MDGPGTLGDTRTGLHAAQSMSLFGRPAWNWIRYVTTEQEMIQAGDETAVHTVSTARYLRSRVRIGLEVWMCGHILSCLTEDFIFLVYSPKKPSQLTTNTLLHESSWFLGVPTVRNLHWLTTTTFRDSMSVPSSKVNYNWPLSVTYVGWWRRRRIETL